MTNTLISVIFIKLDNKGCRKMITSRQVVEIIKKQITNEKSQEGLRALNKVIEKIEVLEDIETVSQTRRYSNSSDHSKSSAMAEANKVFSN